MPKDKAVAWNRLGNAYRKLNQYEQALEAFHKADELDRENSGFRDSMDEVTDGPTHPGSTSSRTPAQRGRRHRRAPIPNEPNLATSPAPRGSPRRTAADLRL